MKPVLFNTEDVGALLAGRKTAARRVVKPQPEKAYRVFDCDEGSHTLELLCGKTVLGVLVDYAEAIKAPYWPGDTLYVREAWATSRELSSDTWACKQRYIYRASYIPCYELDEPPVKWRPSVHMPKEAARIFLRVTDVRVERLQDISGGDLLKEGIDLFQSDFVKVAFNEFENLWNSTLKPADLPRYGWEANPWVWVIEFERISREEASL